VLDLDPSSVCGAGQCGCGDFLGRETALALGSVRAGDPGNSGGGGGGGGRDQTNFASLARTIVYQQLAGAAASTILERFLALCEGGPAAVEVARAAQDERRRARKAMSVAARAEFDARAVPVTSRPFPLPARVLALREEDMRAAGLSAGKTASLRALALAFSPPATDSPGAGTLVGLCTHGMPDAVAVHRLVSVRGVGPWTAEIFLLSHLGRPDILPAGDLTVARGIAGIAGLKPKGTGEKDVLDAAERWRPYRSFVAYMCWRDANTPQVE
jgi:3-methyladenine DNA glycosylase/8-oxoguanine DNA glycosylase